MQVHALTPLAAGAIAVVQVAGSEALTVAEGIFHSRRGGHLRQAGPGRIVYGDFVSADGEVLDDGLAVWGTRAGTTWVEFNVHGGIRIVQRLVQGLQHLGALLAGGPAGPYTPMQTTLGGNTQAPSPVSPLPPEQREGDARHSCDPSFHWLRPLDCWMQACLEKAATQRVVRWLASQPTVWRKHISDWLSRINRGDLQGVLGETEALLAQDLAAIQTWRGRTLAIIGPPNVGKSTLANRLAGRGISLVANAPGTTRDWVDEPIAIQGWPVTIIDTAGLRSSEDALEAEGVIRARQQATQADVRLLVLDAAGPDDQAEDMLLDRSGLKAYDIVVYNKCDLPCRRLGDGREAGLAANQDMFVSSLTGQGWFALEQMILTACGFAALQEQKPRVFCAELQDRLTDLRSSLHLRRAPGAQAILKAL